MDEGLLPRERPEEDEARLPSVRRGLVFTDEDGAVGVQAKRSRRPASAASESLASQVGALAVPVSILSAMIAIRGASFGCLLTPKALVPALETVGAQHAGTTLFLLSTAIGQLGLLRLSDMPFAMSGAAMELMPLYASLASGILSHPSMGTDPSVDAQISTTLATFGVCTTVVSLSYAVSLRLGLGDIFRRCPACVLKGALAGIGSFLIQSALSTAANHELGTQDDLVWLLQMPSITLVQCLLGMGLGVTLYAVDLKFKNPALFISMLVLMVTVANVVPLLGIAGVTQESLEGAGWFFSSPSPAGPWYSVFTALAWSSVCWEAIFSAIPRMVGIAATHQLIVVTDLVNVEAVTGFPVNLDREYKAIGCSSLVSALSCSIPMYVSIGQSITAWRTGGWVERTEGKNSVWKRRSSKIENNHRVARASLPSFRAVGACVAVLTLASMPMFPMVMPRVPRYFVASFFTWLAVVFLRESVWEVFFESPYYLSDSIVVVVMMFSMPFVGFLEGILLGLVLSCITLSFSQTLTTKVIRLRCDGRTIQSNTARLPAHAEYLRMHASNIQVVHLQGALGFGTCRQITDLVEDLAGGQGVAPTFGEEEESTLGRSKFVMVGPAKLARPLYIVVCLRNVTSLDYSAAQQLVKMKNAAVKSHQGSQGKHETVAHHIIYTRYRPEVKRTLIHCGCVNEGDEIVGDVAPGDLPCVALCGSYMRVLAICEDMLLYTATQRGLVSPQLPILPDHLPCAPGEDVRDGDVERQRDIDQGLASQYSVTSCCSESGLPAAFIRPEANAVSARELIAIVLGPYVGQGGQAVDNASSPTGGAPTPAGGAPMLSCPLPILSVELEVLLPLLRPRRLRYGEALWRRGDTARSMFIVHAGKLQVSLPKRNGMNAPATTWSRVMSWHSRSESVSRARNEARGTDARAVAPEQRSGEVVVDVAGPPSTLASGSTPSPSGGLDLSEEALVLEVLIPGSILGYLHAMSTPPQERFADVVVVSEWAAVLEFPLELLPELQATHPILAFGLMQCVLHRCTHEYNNMTQHQVNNDVDWVMPDE